MELSDILSALVVGTLIGALGHVVLPGRQRIGLPMTFLVGIGAALGGLGIARGLGLTGTDGAAWGQLCVQVALAALGVAALDRARHHVTLPHRFRPVRR
ncbi:GlsB/YeaQ/YmgE family stress response membrane protein [Streptomyces axinellae]|uniref:GlsB/YeaQ/YmgE family stress response membrane protein n=1 Tax=Streptomyces axinellae TaxID=552788 RepID=A0ABP6D4P1_9ACTN